MPRAKKKDAKAKGDGPPPKNYNLRSTPDKNAGSKSDDSGMEIAQDEIQIAPKKRAKKKAAQKPYNDATVKQIVDVG